MSELEYDGNWAAELLAAGITPATTPINLRGVIKAILANLNTGKTPTGTAGGVLGGTYPNPTFANAPLSGNLASNYTTTASLATFMTTASLAVGTWLVTMSAAFNLGGAGDFMLLQAGVGTATATLTGKLSSECFVSGQVLLGDAVFTFVAVVTVPGTLIFQAQSNTVTTGSINATTSNGSLPNATGYTAIRVG